MTFQEAVAYLREINLVSMTLRFLLAMVCGGMIGITRGRRQHAAGMRTHLLVCIGSACVVMVGQYYADVMGYDVDPLRLAAQVISGIGFLGAGSIIVTGKSHIVGLTTAAGLWASACMGIAAGAGFYECAILMTVLIYITLVVLNKLDATHIKTSRVIVAYIEVEAGTRISTLLRGMSEIGLEMAAMDQFGRDNQDFCGYRVELEIREPQLRHEDAVAGLSDIEGVSYVEEMKN